MYKHVVGNLAKMKMNFLGLHTYPYKNRLGTGSNEPTVWVGLTEVQKTPPPGDDIHPRMLLPGDGMHPHMLPYRVIYI